MPACAGEPVGLPRRTVTGSTGKFFATLVDYDMIADSLCAQVVFTSVAPGEVVIPIAREQFGPDPSHGANPRDTLRVVLVRRPE